MVLARLVISQRDQEVLKRKDALESAKTAATWNLLWRLLQVDAAIAAIIERWDILKILRRIHCIEAAAVGAIPAIETAGAGCAVPPATTAVCETQIQALTAKLAVVEEKLLP